MFDGKVKLEPKLWGASKNKGVMYTAQQHTILEVLYEYIYQVNEQLYKFCMAALHWGYELGHEGHILTKPKMEIFHVAIWSPN